MSNDKPNIADIRLQLAAMGVDPSRVRGVEVDENGKLLIVVARETPRAVASLRPALVAAIAAASPQPKRPTPIFVDRRQPTPVRAATKLDRYRECECGSGAKFKFCCGRRGA